MRKDEWNSDIRCQVEDKRVNQQGKLNTYKVFNKKTGEVFIDTTCEVVARGKLNRMKAKYGEDVKIETIKRNKEVDYGHRQKNK